MKKLEKLNRKLTYYLGDHSIDYRPEYNREFEFFISSLIDGCFHIDDGNNYPYTISFDSAVEMIEIDFKNSMKEFEMLNEGVTSLELYPTDYGLDVLTEQDKFEILEYVWLELEPYTREGKIKKITKSLQQITDSRIDRILDIKESEKYTK